MAQKEPQARKKITFTCDDATWKEFRKKAIEKDKDYSYYLEELIKKELGK